MDLKDIEIWGRELLQNEARKRGMKNPELYSRAELIRSILRHDYGAPRNVREAARLIGGLLESAKDVLKSRLSPDQQAEPRWTPATRSPEVRRDAQPPAAVKPQPVRADAENQPVAEATKPSSEPQSQARMKAPGATPPPRARARRERTSDVPPPAVQPPVAETAPTAQSEDTKAEVPKSEPPLRESGEFARADEVESTRESGEIRLNIKPSDLNPFADEVEEPAKAEPETGAARESDRVPSGAANRDFTTTQTVLKSRLPLTEADVAPQPIAAALPEREPEPAPPPEPLPASGEHLRYGPHPEHGLLLRWRVSAEAIARARAVLGDDGELAVRIVTVRVDPRAVVETETLDHGPIEEVGDWTAPLVPSAARYVSSIGVRTPARFVSIVHAST